MRGIKVKHKFFGIGTVIEFSNGLVTVEFPSKTSTFIFPDGVEQHLTAVDPADQQKITDCINEVKEIAERLRQEAEATRKAAEELRRAEISKKTSYTPKPIVRAQRVDGKRMVFFVFQGNSFEKEYQGGYLWAPIENKAGMTFHHWDRLLDVRKGDIILHGCDGYIQAISVALDACYNCELPPELAVEDLWDMDGRRVDCDYIRINNPIKTVQFIDDILRLSQAKYSPFNRDGGGNMGYLYEINRELAHIFVKASVEQNPYLGAVEYIDEFLSEENND